MKAKELHGCWHGVEIGRDKNGFAEAECYKLYEIMRNDLPLLIHDARDNTFEAINTDDQLEEWVSDIYVHPHYDMYLYQFEQLPPKKGGEQ